MNFDGPLPQPTLDSLLDQDIDQIGNAAVFLSRPGVQVIVHRLGQPEGNARLKTVIL
jgi:hypothetical protein